MLTLRELKKRVVKADANKKVPTSRALQESDVRIAMRDIMKDGSLLTVYENGYVVYWRDGHDTVFPLHECNEYRYDFNQGAGNMYTREFFEDQDWYLRLLLEGEDRLEHNQDKRIGSHSISYSAVSEDWDALKIEENILSELVRQEEADEALAKLLSLMTENQGKMMIRIYIDEIDQQELAREAGITQQAISDMIRKAKKRVRKAYGEHPVKKK